MRIPAHHPARPAPAALLVPFLLGALACAAAAHELKDVSLIAAGGKARLNLAFVPAPGEGEYPLYFQKADASKGTLTLSFLETGTVFPLGRHALDTAAPELEEITLKKITSPSGKAFLGIELKLADPASPILAKGEAEVLIAPKGVLRVEFGKTPVRKYGWSLASALKAGDAYLSAKAAPEPKSAREKAAADKAAEREVAEVFSAPVPDEPGSAPPAGDASGPGKAAAKEANPSAAASRSKVKADGKSETAAGGIADASPDPVTSAHADGQAIEARRSAAAKGASAGGLSSSRVFVLGTGGKTLVMLKDSASLRSDPGPQGKVLRKLPIGGTVEKLETKGGALRVAAGQDTGWIRAGEAVYSDEITAAQEKSIASRIASNRARMEAALARQAAAQAREEEKRRKADSLAADKAAKLAEKQRKADSLAADKAARLAEKQRKADSLTAARLAAKQRKADSLAADKAARLAEKQRKADSAAGEAARKLAEKKAAEEARKQALAAANPPQGVLEAGAAPNRPGMAADAAPGQPGGASPSGAQAAPKLGLADNPELAGKLAQEKLAAEEEKKRIEPEENRVTYNSYGRRDPFIPVEQGASDNGIDIDQMKVVGIIWQASQPMAVLEHNREAGVSFTVKEGDPVHNGRVARISHDAVTFDISEYGISRSYSLRLVSQSAKEGTKR